MVSRGARGGLATSLRPYQPLIRAQEDAGYSQTFFRPILHTLPIPGRKKTGHQEVTWQELNADVPKPVLSACEDLMG